MSGPAAAMPAWPEVLLTAGQMRAAERAAIGEGTASGLELMERAGRAVVTALLEAWPVLARGAPRAAVLCGPGNNGGDGFVVARLLRERGWQVSAWLLGEAGRLPPDAAHNQARWAEAGAVQALTGDVDPGAVAGQGGLVVVDGLFGTGLARPVERLGPLFARLARMQDARRVAIDIPSGLCSDSGRVLGEGPGPQVFPADLTVSFHTAKPGHYLAEGPRRCGHLDVRGIGLPPPDPEGGAAVLAAPAQGALPKASWAHKYDHGHALVLSGGAGRTGAARLAARGALRVGAGLVTLGVPPAAQSEVAAQVTAVMLRRVAEAAALTALLEDRRLNALCLGPGLGVDRARPLVLAALEAARPAVLDADALSAFAGAPAALLDRLHPGCVLTPHGGEFARLFPDLAARLAAPAAAGPAFSRLDAARAAAARAGCTVLLKGADTVIAEPGGRAAVSAAAYARAAPWLATAGAGDVLAGMICGLLARGLGPFDAARTAAFCHVEAARVFGPGLIAEDLPEALPAVLRALGA